MRVVITEWDLQSYLDLEQRAVFSDSDYWDTIRPDVELLKQGLSPPAIALQNGRLFGPATDRSGNAIQHGYKMKWHNLGPGAVQLRLSVAVIGDTAYLCRAWVKDSPATDKREAAKLKHHINAIVSGRYATRGEL